MPHAPLNLAVLVSGSGTTLQNLLDVIRVGALDAHVSIVVGSKPGLQALQRAADAKVMNFVADRAGFASLGDFSRAVFSLVDDAGADLVCLAGWLCLLEIPPAYHGRVMNIHPALLPSFGGRGFYGKRVHQAVLETGCKVSGCTVHFVDAGYDTGPIILQRTCPVMEGDTPDTLAQRVAEEEKFAYPDAIRLFQQRRLTIEGRRVRVTPAAS